MSVHSIRAFSDPKYTYYRLTRDLGELKEGAIFYHDPDDSCLGSPAQGCIKLCWASNGNCYRYCGGAVIFHWDFANSDLWFYMPNQRKPDWPTNLSRHAPLPWWRQFFFLPHFPCFSARF